jgi:hypothetical protein
MTEGNSLWIYKHNEKLKGGLGGNFSFSLSFRSDASTAAPRISTEPTFLDPPARGVVRRENHFSSTYASA